MIRVDQKVEPLFSSRSDCRGLNVSRHVHLACRFQATAIRRCVVLWLHYPWMEKLNLQTLVGHKKSFSDNYNVVSSHCLDLNKGWAHVQCDPFYKLRYFIYLFF